MEIVSQRIRALRESVGLSQAKIAQLLDSKQASINRFEHNQSEPPLALLCRYADFFDVSLDYIFGRTDQPQGKLYEYRPAYSPEREDMRRFTEMCFEPGSPANAKLKEMLLNIVMDDDQSKNP